MFAPLFSAVRADAGRQIDWVKDEFRRQIRHTLVVGVLASLAALCGLGAIVTGFVALYFWLATEMGSFSALGAIGGGLLLIGAILLAVMLTRTRPEVASRPPLQLVRPAALLGTLQRGSYNKAVTHGERAIDLATHTLRSGSRPALWGTLVLVALIGLVAARSGR